MRMLTPSALILSIAISMSPDGRLAQAQEAALTRGEAAVAFSSGAIQKTTPRDGIVNLITGDNQSSGNRMILGTQDTLYLKLDNPADAAVGDLFTVYRRVRKVLHPLTKEYLGFVMIRLAIVKVTDTSHALTTVKSVVNYGPIYPGDLVMRFAAPPVGDIGQRVDTAEVDGMIVELQADRPMTMVAQSNVVYVDRGNAHGIKTGDLMDILRHSTGLPTRKIGQLKVLSTEERTATARIVKANTRVLKGDRFKLVGYSEPVVQPVETTPPSAKTDQPVQEAAVPSAKTEQPAQETAVLADLVAGKLKGQDASGQSRINLGDLATFLRYESGEAAIRPESYKALDQLIEHLLASGDTRLIRVEGHTDNVEIGPSLKARYPSNVDLSKARAGSVVRYLIEKGGLDSARLSSVGYGDSRPAATNANEDGRSKNRRVELVLYEPDTEPQAPPSNADNQAQRQESDPAVLNARGTTSRLAAPPNSPPTSGSGMLSTSEQRQQEVSGKRPETLDSPDTGGAMPSGGEQRTQAAAGNGPTVQNNPPASDTSSQEAGKQSDAPQSIGTPGL